MNNNILTVILKMVNHLKLKVAHDSLYLYLLSHPNYPSLNSISDTLHYFNIKNYPVRTSQDELLQAGSPFFALMGKTVDSLVFVPTIDNSSDIRYYDSTSGPKANCIKRTTFFKSYSGVSILLDINKEDKDLGLRVGINNSPKALTIFALIFTFFSLLFLNHHSIIKNFYYQCITLYILYFIGLIFSFLIVLRHLNVKTHITNSICKLNSKTDCNEILNSSSAKLFGWLYWADLGVVYFVTGILMLTLYPGYNTFVFMVFLSALALSYTIYSIFFQGFVAKKWCTLCLLVQVVLILCFFLNVNVLSFNPLLFNFFIPYSLLFCGVLILFLLTKNLLISNDQLRQLQLSNLKLKRHPEIASILLREAEARSLFFPNEIIRIGAEKASIKITAFLSLDCRPCQIAFNSLKRSFTADDIQLNLVFLVKNESYLLLSLLYKFYQEKKYVKLIEHLDLWYKSTPTKRESLINKIKKEYSLSNNVPFLHSNMQLFSSLRISGTPKIFINDKLIPKEYNLTELDLLLNSLKMKIN